MPLGLAADSGSILPRGKKMEGEDKKATSKKRSKSIQVKLDAEDDEPIGSLFKVKTKRNPKKVKMESDLSGEKVKDSEVEADNLRPVKRNLGMNDTLASFRKKIKGPKKDNGTGMAVQLRFDSNATSGQLSDAPVEDGPLATEADSEEVQAIRENEPTCTISKGTVHRGTEKSRRPKRVSQKNNNMGGGIGFDDSRDDKGSADRSVHIHDNSEDAHSEDALSTFLQKAQSESGRKSHSYLKMEQRKELQDPEVYLSSEDVSKDLLSMTLERKAPTSSDLPQKDSQSDDSLLPGSDSIQPDIFSNQSKILIYDPSTENMLEDQKAADAINMKSDDNIQGDYAKAFVKESVSVSCLKKTQSCLTACSSKLYRPTEGEFLCQTVGVQVGPTQNNGVSDHLNDRVSEEPVFAEVKGDISHQSGTPGSQNQNITGGFRSPDLAHNAEMPYTVTVSVKAKDILQLDACESDAPFNEKNDVDSPKNEADIQLSATGICWSQHQSSSSGGISVSNKEGNCSDIDGLGQVPENCTEEPDCASGPVQKEDAELPESRASLPTSRGLEKSEATVQLKHLEELAENDQSSNHFLPELGLNESAASAHMCCSSAHQASIDVPKETPVLSRDYLSGNGEFNGVSSRSITPDRDESYAGVEGNIKDKKQSVVQRAVRKAKKRRHEDMAYEGDAAWNLLIPKQAVLESHLVVDGDKLSRHREKFNSSSSTFAEVENWEAAAVSAGLKARAVGPVEKIKFKEVLKRKGGGQEYLHWRNQILGLWSKDVGRVLPLTECGVSDVPSVEEPSHASLVREIYAFLDQSGYINVGVASDNGRPERSAMQNVRLVNERNCREKVGVADADTDDGVSFILGQIRSSEESLGVKNGDLLDDQNLATGAAKNDSVISPRTTDTDLATTNKTGECIAKELHRNDSFDPKPLGGRFNSDILSTNLSCEVLNGGAVTVFASDLTNLNERQSASTGDMEHNHDMRHNSDSRKRIIVIGAGPAGLTAARHLQRQGFSVTVLEARGRVGGRVYTDRSSLSVPVDLGASIITGVEADVDTGRRADPSSLVCNQLGLELTVLNSDCPLYDTVTGQKVPAELDEALEAEYNSLLDDMLLVVAEKGEQAMKMSLEDGLEYALRNRRLPSLDTNPKKNGVHDTADALLDSEKIVADGNISDYDSSKTEVLSPLERRVMDWHFAHLEYGCAASLKEVSLPYWNQDDVYGGFGGPHCMIKGGYSSVVESLGEGLGIRLNHVVTDISYGTKECREEHGNEVKVSTSNGRTFSGDAVLITVPLGCLKAETIAFSPPLPPWKRLSIKRLGFGVLNKVVLEFPEVFWDDSIDYFGATAEETDKRGQCFMFWNVKKTVGAPVLIALVVGKAAIDGQHIDSTDHVDHAIKALRKLFGEAAVPNPVASVVTDWGKDPFSYGAYSYVAVGASGEDYDILGRPVGNCLFFAGEATCKEHPDTVGGAMMSGLREAVRIIDILTNGTDCTAEVEAMQTLRRHSDSERSEVRDIVKRLEAVQLSNVLYKNSLDGDRMFTKESLLRDMFSNAKTTAGRLHLAKELLSIPVEALKSFAGTRDGLSILNSWILDSMGKNGTQLLRHCVRILVLVSTDLLAVRMSGIGKTVKEKVCVHTSRDIRAIASQLVNVWVEVFRKEKAGGGLKLLKQSSTVDSMKSKSVSGKPPLRVHGRPDASSGSDFPPSTNLKRLSIKPAKSETRSKTDSKLEAKLPQPQDSVAKDDTREKDDHEVVMSEEEKAALAAAEAAEAAARAAAEALASSGNTSLPLPKIMSFHKFARREQYAQMDDSDKRKLSGGALGRQDCISEIDSRNCRVRDWSVDFSAACVNLDKSKMSVDNLSQRSQSNELREQSAESAAVDSNIFTRAWVDGSSSVGVKDCDAINRWQSQAAAAVESDYLLHNKQMTDDEESNMNPKLPTWRHEFANESSVSHVTVNNELVSSQPRGADRIKQAVVEYVGSLLMPLYKAKKIDKEGYKSIMKKTATKVMEQTTDAEKAMAVYEFLDFKRKNKIRAFVDKLIERHMAAKPADKP